MDDVLEALRRRLAVTEGRYGTWLTCTEAAALLPVLEKLQRRPSSRRDSPKMVRGPEQHKAVLSPDEDKRSSD